MPMNKKKLKTISVLIALMLVLIISQRFFEDKFKDVALIDNNIGELKEYRVEDGKYTFLLPENWSVEEKGNASGYMSYNGEFEDENSNIIGCIQVINTGEDVKLLAQNDIDNLTLSHDSQKVDNFKDKKYSGIRVDYKTKIEKGYNYDNSVYYIKLDNEKVAKYIFSVNEKNYKDNQRVIFDTIVSSTKEKLN